jgi:hypothetical protein
MAKKLGKLRARRRRAFLAYAKWAASSGARSASAKEVAKRYKAVSKATAAYTKEYRKVLDRQ